MSFISLEQMSYQDGPTLDAFGRLRVSSMSTLFAYHPGPTDSPLYFDNYTSGTGTNSYTAGASVLSTGGSASGARSMRQTKVYWRYHPGKSLLCRFAIVLNGGGTPAGAAVARKGYFDDNNGAFFGRDVGGYFVAYRTNVSGTPVDIKVYQANWNVDSCSSSGLNPSGVTVDFTRINLMGIDFLAAGSGRIRFHIYLEGRQQIVHEFVLGLLPGAYIGSLDLPLTAEVYNAGGSGASISMADYSMSLHLEDGSDSGDGGYVTSCGTKGAVSASLPNSATLTPIMTVRVRDTFNGTTYRGHIHPTELDMLAFTNDVYWEIRWNCTLTGASFALVDSVSSGIELDLSATAATGGTLIHAGYAKGGNGNSANLMQQGHFQSYTLARTYANVRDTMTLMARGIGGVATAAAVMSFEEQY